MLDGMGRVRRCRSLGFFSFPTAMRHGRDPVLLSINSQREVMSDSAYGAHIVIVRSF